MDVHTWADGHGLWHAAVTCSVGKAPEGRKAARDAINREITYRHQNDEPQEIVLVERSGKGLAVRWHYAEAELDQ